MVLKIILYIVTLLIGIWPIANFFQSAFCGLFVRIFVPKEIRVVSFINWPWYIKAVSFLVAVLFWFCINEIWKYLTDTSIPMVLAGLLYIAVALYTKNKKDEMNYIFRTNKTNEIYATLVFFIYQLFIAKGASIF